MAKKNKVVVSGGPGGGKTTAADLFLREMEGKVAVVPEAATILYSGGFPRSQNFQAKVAAQIAIFNVQRQLEEATRALNPSQLLVCDRGTIDGAAFWPGPSEDFFKTMNTSLEDELKKYDAVLFFETAAVGGNSIKSSNRVRTESLEEAIELDKKLKSLWGQHPHFIFVPNSKSFIEKVNLGLKELMKICQTNGNC
jgi:predicted ATPase